MKKTLLYIIFFTNYVILSQTTTISQILQKTLQQENEARKMVYTEVDTLGNGVGLQQMDIDTIEETEPFVIKNDTLYYTIKHHFAYEKGYYLDQQIVALKDIVAVTKDIGIFFETAPDKVTLIRKEYYDDGNYIKSSTTNDLFRTHFISLRQNEYLANQLVKAFKKAGYTLEKGYWYD
jgi:hypothetical protein